MTNISKKIKDARVEAKFSQGDLAGHLKLSDKSISAYESQRAVPPIDVLKKIASLTNKPISYFFDQDEKKDTTLRRVESKLKEIESLFNDIKHLLHP